MHVAIVEPSSIIIEGLSSTLHRSGAKLVFSKTDTIDDLLIIHTRQPIDFVLINPSIVQTNLKGFNSLKCQFESTRWIAIVYAFYTQQLLSQFDGLFYITDDINVLVKLITKPASVEAERDSESLEAVLSDRENDVLKLLATGMANKEIADKLNISTNTVITHRKNISAKTGIKSVSGLTIYAVVKKLLTLDALTSNE